MNKDEAIKYLKKKGKIVNDESIKEIMKEGKIYGDPVTYTEFWKNEQEQ